ncbi:MAG: hypothetical protein LBE83_00460, partial [Propionibacteriaceae bacterium]|nr:hypothetical protein [Propionibacteriaceae bacterium]
MIKLAKSAGQPDSLHHAGLKLLVGGVIGGSVVSVVTLIIIALVAHDNRVGACAIGGAVAIVALAGSQWFLTLASSMPAKTIFAIALMTYGLALALVVGTL